MANRSPPAIALQSLSVAEEQLRCHLPLIGKLFRNMVDSVDLANWKKRLVILNWTMVTGNGHPPAPSGLEAPQDAPRRRLCPWE
jgi:hypothetical protein